MALRPDWTLTSYGAARTVWPARIAQIASISLATRQLEGRQVEAGRIYKVSAKVNATLKATRLASLWSIKCSLSAWTILAYGANTLATANLAQTASVYCSAELERLDSPYSIAVGGKGRARRRFPKFATPIEADNATSHHRKPLVGPNQSNAVRQFMISVDLVPVCGLRNCTTVVLKG